MLHTRRCERRSNNQRVSSHDPTPADGPAYQPYYCEENIWLLAQDPRVGDGERLVALITGEVGRFAMWHQRSADGPNAPVLWDYHVVLLARQDRGWQAWDFDCDLGMPIAVTDWWDASFPRQDQVRSAYRPHFRVLPAAEYVSTLRSDRSHMRDADGSFLKPPPAWAPPGGGLDSNLVQFVDLRGAFIGEVLDLNGLRQRLAD